MLPLYGTEVRFGRGTSRREVLRLGGLGALGLALPRLLQARQAPAAAARPAGGFGRARSCIVLFLMGGPPQHSTWDPKPGAPANVRGAFAPIATRVPGTQICELMPRLARWTDKLAILRAVSTSDNAHSSSGYYMMTGRPHQPMNFENANPGAPNDWPTLGALVQSCRRERGLLPAAIRLPHRIFNTDGSVWPGQDAGFLGRAADPWLFTCHPGAPRFHLPEFALDSQMSPPRLHQRQSLLRRLDHDLAAVQRSGVLATFDRYQQRAFD